MAKKRKKKQWEFRPDRPRSSWMEKLYITKRQRQVLLRWGLQGLVVLLCLLVQDTIMSKVSIFGATTDLTACAILLIAITQSTENGCVFALTASTLFFWSGSAPGAYAIILLTFLELGASVLRQSYLRRGFLSTAVCTAVALLVYELGVLAVCALTGVSYFGRLPVFLISWLLSLTAIPALYPVCRAIDKIGGEAWND
ncbi:MAG TPA: hypothetical protein IAC31_03035 [Candidatus Faecousia intestinigallinarum]|nr:hypothetical protein [Candidatus Faecousia intestinigallinarum]